MDGLLRESLFTVGFPGAYGGKGSACQYRRHKRHRFNLGSGRSPGGGQGNPLQHLCLESHGQRNLAGYSP